MLDINLIRENPEKKILVFVRTKIRAERVFKALERIKINSQTIHSDKAQKERSAIMGRFKSGENTVLIATDVSARGIDIPNVEIVVNYDLPEIPENYVHRVGRTGRGSQKGLAISFCSPQEEDTLKTIESFLKKSVKVIDIDIQDYKDTIDLSKSTAPDWQTLIDEAESYNDKKRKKR